MDTIKDTATQSFEAMKHLNRQIVLEFLKKNWRYIILFGISIAVLVLFIEYSYSIRVPRYLRGLNNIVQYVKLEPISECLDYIKDYKLADFYVASSARSYLSGSQYKDYATERATAKILRSGARFLEFEIFNKDFKDNTVPIVSTGIERGNVIKTLNTLPFETCCKTIERIAFSEKYLTNPSDPLFISIKLSTNRNIDTINKVAKIIEENLGGRLLSRNYSYSKKNIGQERLKDLIGKVIIFGDKNAKGTKLEELINQTWGTAFLREANYEEIQETPDHKYLTDWNRRNLTMVHPLRDISSSMNYNPYISWKFGCQFVALNYQNVDNHMKDNIIKFSKRSFVLKPSNLRYKPTYYNRPRRQDPNMSLGNINLRKPGINITL